jgi:hypothetical protein
VLPNNIKPKTILKKDKEAEYTGFPKYAFDMMRS